MKSYEQIKQELITECNEDYVGLWILIKQLKRVYPEVTTEEIRSMTLRLVWELLSEGNIQPGDFRDKTFHAWDLTPEEVLARIEVEWKNLGRMPNIGEIVWFTRA